ncbi:MAG: VCBS repeat-containing protein, partial [Chloroflexi bacterium]|nr:VCBS repeat-containing protein [Chloroflexota bacterium]
MKISKLFRKSQALRALWKGLSPLLIVALLASSIPVAIEVATPTPAYGAEAGEEKVTRWSDKITHAPSGMGDQHDGGGVAIADIDGNGTLDLLVMAIDDPSGANEFRFYVGWDLNKDTGVPASWSEKTTFKPSGMGDSHQGGGVAIADIDGNGSLDLLLMAIDDPVGQNVFRFYVGRDLNKVTGVPASWSEKTTFKPSGMG